MKCDCVKFLMSEQKTFCLFIPSARDIFTLNPSDRLVQASIKPNGMKTQSSIVKLFSLKSNKLGTDNAFTEQLL